MAKPSHEELGMAVCMIPINALFESSVHVPSSPGEGIATDLLQH